MFSPKLKEALQHRRSSLNFNLLPADKSKKRIWFHCSSYGEFEGILPLLQAYADKAENQCIVSFYSPSGFTSLHTHPLIDYCFYLPFDTKKAMRRLLTTIQPDVLLISQNEYWPNMIQESLTYGLPIYYISSYVRPKHWWLKSSLRFITKPLREVNQIFLQDQESYRLLTQAGYQNVFLLGNTRVDQVLQNASTKKDYPKIKEFIAGSTVLIAGSTLKTDEEVILNAFGKTDGLKLILVPHEPAQFTPSQLPKDLQSDYCQLSTYECTDNQKKILIVDTLGDLKYLYRYANLAFVGGGFDEGVHSVLEAAVYEIPILTGPNIKKFQDAVNLHQMGVVTLINSADELVSRIKGLRAGLTPILTKNLQIYLKEHSGATQRMLDLIRF